MKNLFMGVLGLLVALTITNKAYSANTENLTSPIGTNLTSVNYWMPEWIFVDAFAESRPWVSNLCSGGWDNGPAISKDSNGWVSSLAAGQCVDTQMFIDNDGHYPAGEYVILWEGDGQFAVFQDPDSVFDSDWAAKTTNNGIKRSTFTISKPTNNGIQMKITSLKADYLKNFRLIMPGGVCGRGLNDLDYFAYCRTSRGGSGTCGSGQTCYDFEQVYWDRFKDSTSTMNNPKVVFHPEFLNKMKKYRGIRYLDWTATINSSLQNWTERADIKQQTYADHNFTPGQQGKGVPYEFITALSNVLNADVWLNIPAKSTDDYNTQFAAFMKNNLASNLKVYVEYSNEVWNSDYSDDRDHMIAKANELGITCSAITYLTSGCKVARYYAKRAGERYTLYGEAFFQANPTALSGHYPHG